MIDIKGLLGTTENFQAADALRTILFSERKNEVLERYVNECGDMSTDHLNEYFQAQNADRKSLMQDYTPESICKIVSYLIDKDNPVLDMCSGTGSLTIQTLNRNHEREIYCEEYSGMAFMFLLLNLTARNVRGIASRKDVLTGNTGETYRLIPSDKFSIIEPCESVSPMAQNTIMNPPYSMRWEQKSIGDWHGIPPESKADYAFVLTALERTTDTLVCILPHGVLFRGQAEREIRKEIIEKNYLDMLIGMPDKMFMNTSIPTVIMVLKKHRTHDGVLIIDTSKNCTKKNKNNVLIKNEIQKVLDVAEAYQDCEKYAHVSSIQEIRDNDYNLNIPRYVDTSEPEEIPDFYKTVDEIIELENEIGVCRNKVINSMMALTTGDEKEDKRFRDKLKRWKSHDVYEQMRMDI